MPRPARAPAFRFAASPTPVAGDGNEARLATRRFIRGVRSLERTCEEAPYAHAEEVPKCHAPLAFKGSSRPRRRLFVRGGGANFASALAMLPGIVPSPIAPATSRL